MGYIAEHEVTELTVRVDELERERDGLAESLAIIWDMLKDGDQEHAEGYVSQAVRRVVEERARLRRFAAIVLRFEGDHIGTTLLADEAKRLGIDPETL